jgi:hypothetical protein
MDLTNQQGNQSPDHTFLQSGVESGSTPSLPTTTTTTTTA